MLLKNFRRLIRLYNEINPFCVVLLSNASTRGLESLNNEYLILPLVNKDKEYATYKIRRTLGPITEVRNSEYAVTVMDLCETVNSIGYSDKNAMDVYITSGMDFFDVVGVYYNETGRELQLIVQKLVKYVKYPTITFHDCGHLAISSPKDRINLLKKCKVVVHDTNGDECLTDSGISCIRIKKFKSNRYFYIQKNRPDELQLSEDICFNIYANRYYNRLDIYMYTVKE